MFSLIRDFIRHVGGFRRVRVEIETSTQSEEPKRPDNLIRINFAPVDPELNVTVHPDVEPRFQAVKHKFKHYICIGEMSDGTIIIGHNGVPPRDRMWLMNEAHVRIW